MKILKLFLIVSMILVLTHCKVGNCGSKNSELSNSEPERITIEVGSLGKISGEGVQLYYCGMSGDKLTFSLAGDWNDSRIITYPVTKSEINYAYGRHSSQVIKMKVIEVSPEFITLESLK